MTDKKPLLIADNISYELSTSRTLFKDVRLSINQGERIALVGANGVGKSSLLKILAGEIQPNSGSVARDGVIYYLPQINTIPQLNQEVTVLEFLISYSEEWWEIANQLEKSLGTFLDLSLPMKSLSGGKLTKLFLAIGLHKNPSLLLLDEPTNYLDFLALENLSDFLNKFNGAFVIVSHKPFFLDRVANKIWELTASGIKVYGGNYSDYKLQKETELQVALRTIEIAKKELKRVTESALIEEQRAAKSKREGRKQSHDRSMGKSARRYFENRASGSAGNAAKKHDAAITQAKENLESVKIRTNKATIVHLAEGNIKKGRNLVDIQGADLKIGDEILIKGIQLHIASGDRISISGANGSGKSSLIKAILGIKEENSAPFLDLGEVLISANIKVLYLDQKYQIVNRRLTVLENMQQANSSLKYQLLRQQLGHFLFFGDDVNKSAEFLSGGELARLALAMISISEIDLLVLDEPTNNLDLETVSQILEALEEYRGAICVISHDLDFLRQLEITKAFRIKEKSLQPMIYLPEETDEFYRELIN